GGGRRGAGRHPARRPGGRAPPMSRPPPLWSHQPLPLASRPLRGPGSESLSPLLLALYVSWSILRPICPVYGACSHTRRKVEISVTGPAESHASSRTSPATSFPLITSMLAPL